MSGFVAFHRGEQTSALLKNDPNAFLLLCLIAQRARYTEDVCPTYGLRFGEAFIGDWKAAGLKSEKAYRCAKQRLEKGRLCVFKRARIGASQGTIATLLPNSIFSISAPSGADGKADKGRSEGGQRATNNKETKKQGNNTPIVPKGDGPWSGVFPERAKSRSKAEQKQIKVLKNNEQMIYVGKWFGRRENTLWSVAEAQALQLLSPSKEEVRVMNEYRSKPNEFHRRDLMTLLNNWQTELDRARSAETDSAKTKEGPTCQL